MAGRYSRKVRGRTTARKTIRYWSAGTGKKTFHSA
jgi:hypothetical protein